MKTIRDYLPVEISKTLVQARVDSRIVKQVKTHMGFQDLTWNELVEACLKKFLDEMEWRDKK